MHNFAVTWTQKYAGGPGPTGRADVDAVLRDVLVCVPLAVCIAWCTYNLIEKQFFIYRRKYVEPAAAQA
jgi:peptidoglycan/LPS O-acetylase OafA/YrhL